MKRRSLIISCLGISIISICILSVGALAYFFSIYRDAGIAPLSQTTSAQVAISNPPTATAWRTFEPISIEATAIGPDPFLSIELWVNGEVAEVQASPSNRTPYFASFVWVPDTPGMYSLIARATDVQTATFTSTSVVVLIEDDEALTETSRANTGGQAGIASDVVLLQEDGAARTAEAAAIRALNLPAPAQPPIAPDPPGPNESIGASTAWTGTPGNWITNLIARSKPAAPEIVGAVQGCAAELLIHDISNNEEGFAVYAHSLLWPDWRQVATLSSQSQVDWLSFTHAGTPGLLTFYVSALNGQGEAASNPVSVDIDAARCPEQPAGLPVLGIELTGLVADPVPERAYCYRSLAGELWSRWPVVGFFTPDQGSFNIQGQVENIVLQDADGQALLEDMTLRLECWGWFGGEVELMGEFSHSIDSRI